MSNTAPPGDAAPLECGCTPTRLVCTHHRTLFEYAQAFDRSSDRTGSDLPDLVLRPSLKTWLQELDAFRTVLLALLVLGVPVLSVVMGASIRFALGAVVLFLVPIALYLLTFANVRLTLDARTRTVHFRNWRRRTVHLPVDDEMRAQGFQYVDLGVSSFAGNVVLWTPGASVRLDQRVWGIDRLDDLVFVLGVPVGGVHEDRDVEELFPGTLPLIARHPKAAAAVILLATVGALFAVLATVAVLTPDHRGDGGADRPSQSGQDGQNGARPTSMPADVESRQDALDASLRKVLAGDVAWVTESTIHPCNEQPGWQREVTHRIQTGGHAASDRLVASFTATVEKAGLHIEQNGVRGSRLVLGTEYASATGAGVTVYLAADTQTSPRDDSISLSSTSECVVTSS